LHAPTTSVGARGETRLKTSTTAATIRLIVCCLGLTAFFTTADVAHATSDRDHGKNYHRSGTDCGRSESCELDRERPDFCSDDRDCREAEYCGTDRKCHARPSCDDEDACTADRYEGKGRCSHTRIDGCESRRVAPRGATSRLRIKSTLARSGLTTINPTKQVVLLQIRPAGNRDILCARMPASKFMVRRRTSR